MRSEPQTGSYGGLGFGGAIGTPPPHAPVAQPPDAPLPAQHGIGHETCADEPPAEKTASGMVEATVTNASTLADTVRISATIGGRLTIRNRSNKRHLFRVRAGRKKAVRGLCHQRGARTNRLGARAGDAAHLKEQRPGSRQRQLTGAALKYVSQAGPLAGDLRHVRDFLRRDGVFHKRAAAVRS